MMIAEDLVQQGRNKRTARGLAYERETHLNIGSK